MSGINGIICIDKPEGFTSFDVVAVMRKATHQKKLGHCGTLDPFATGVLPILFGRTAKFQDYITFGNKKYRASVKLGITSDTLDRTGELGPESDVSVDEETVKSVLKSFVGKQLQIPPAYSAIQVGGRRLYDLAREGKIPEVPPREIEIYSIDNISFDDNIINFEVECSKGTYIRALARDIGEKIGCGACLWELRRLVGSGFTVDDCVSLEEAKTNFEKYILPVDIALTNYERLDVNSRESYLLLNGQAISKKVPEGLYKVYDKKHGFLGVFNSNGTKLKAKTLFIVKEEDN